MTQPRRPDPKTSIAIVVPLHEFDENGKPVVVRRPGRPRRVERAPTIDERVYLETVAAEAEHAISTDPIVTASSGTPDPATVVEKTMQQVAQEAAGLLWLRQRAVRDGADGAKLASRRVAALLKVGELAVLREQLARESGDLDPQHVMQAVGMLVSEVEETVRDVAEPEVANTFMCKLRERMKAANFPASAATQGAAR
jgi:hypothetical protein